MIDATAFNAALDRVAARLAADEAALAASAQVETDAQAVIDSATAKLDALVPPPTTEAPADPAPVDPAPAQEEGQENA